MIYTHYIGKIFKFSITWVGVYVTPRDSPILLVRVKVDYMEEAGRNFIHHADYL